MVGIESILIGLGIGAAGWTVISQVSKSRTRKDYRSSYRYLRIIPHETVVADSKSINKLVSVFHELSRSKSDRRSLGREWYRFWIYKSAQGKLEFYMGYPEDRKTGVFRSLQIVYPDIEMKELQTEEVPLSWSLNEQIPVYGGEFVLKHKRDKEGFAFKQYDKDQDFEDILACLDAGEKESEAFFEVLFSPESEHMLRKVVKRSIRSLQKSKYQGANGSASLTDTQAWKSALMGHQGASKKPIKQTVKDMDSEDKERLKMLQNRYTGRESVFQVHIRIMVKATYANAIVQTAANSVKRAFAMDNGLHLKPNKRIDQDMFTFAPIPNQGLIMIGEELANVFRLPDGGHRIYAHIPHLKMGQRLLEKNELAEGIKMGIMEHPMEQNREVRIPFNQFTRHFLLSGKSGAGKSAALIEMLDSVIFEFIHNPAKAPGFTLIDPAEETVATILNRLRHYSDNGQVVDWSKVHYFNFIDDEYVLPLNIMRLTDPSQLNEVAEEVLARICSEFQVAPQMEKILRNSLITLLSDTQQHTILGITGILENPGLRRRILPKVKDPMIRNYWATQFEEIEKKLNQALAPLYNRLSPLIMNRNMRRMFGHPEMGLDIRRWMDEGHIVLFNVKGLSKQALRLCEGFTLDQYHKIAQTRGTGSRVHLLIEDEAHRGQFPVMEKIIAEDRKFGLSLGLSTQNVEQLEPFLVKAIEIMGNIFTGKLGPSAAARMGPMMSNKFSKEYFQELPERRIAIYTASELPSGQKVEVTTVVECEPPYVYLPGGKGKWANYKDDEEMKRAFQYGLEKGRELMARDAIPVAEVDALIDEYIATGQINDGWQMKREQPQIIQKPSAAGPLVLRRRSKIQTEEIDKTEESHRSRWE